MRGEILLSAAASFVPSDLPASAEDAPPDSPFTPTDAPIAPRFDVQALVEPEWWDAIPPDVPELLALLPHADLYVQDEVDVRHHPTLTRVWSRKGHHGQRLVPAPGVSPKVVGFAAIDWRDGWCSWGFSLGRTADVFVKQLDHLVERSQARGRIAVALVDNARIHTPQGAKLVRDAQERHGAKLRLVYTPAYDPDANPMERLFPPFRTAVTHNHHRAHFIDLVGDARTYFVTLDARPDEALRHVGSPFAIKQDTPRLLAA